MAIVNVPQGNINRLLAAAYINAFPALNVTAQYVGKEGLRLSLEGNATTLIDTLTGGVQSPEPYMRCTLTAHLLRSQPLAAAWHQQLLQSSTIGDVTCYGDTKQMTPYSLTNMAIMTLREFNFDGTDPGYVLTLGGYYVINASLYQ